MKKILSIFVVSFALVFSSNLFANKIGVIYDSGGKFDKSFNELEENELNLLIKINQCFAYLSNQNRQS